MADNDTGVCQEKIDIGKYLVARLPTLKPPIKKAPNPFSALFLPSKKDWLFFSVCYRESSTFSLLLHPFTYVQQSTRSPRQVV
jgi:hypothetical protein